MGITNSKMTDEEAEMYRNIKNNGTMDDMFEFAYAVGRVNLLKEQVNELHTNL